MKDFHKKRIHHVNLSTTIIRKKKKIIQTFQQEYRKDKHQPVKEKRGKKTRTEKIDAG